MIDREIYRNRIRNVAFKMRSNYFWPKLDVHETFLLRLGVRSRGNQPTWQTGRALLAKCIYFICM